MFRGKDVELSKRCSARNRLQVVPPPHCKSNGELSIDHAKGPCGPLDGVGGPRIAEVRYLRSSGTYSTSEPP